jgi:hypothetical protein
LKLGKETVCLGQEEYQVFLLGQVPPTRSKGTGRWRDTPSPFLVSTRLRFLHITVSTLIGTNTYTHTHTHTHAYRHTLTVRFSVPRHCTSVLPPSLVRPDTSRFSTGRSRDNEQMGKSERTGRWRTSPNLPKDNDKSKSSTTSSFSPCGKSRASTMFTFSTPPSCGKNEVLPPPEVLPLLLRVLRVGRSV